MKRFAVGIDIGGTKVAIGLVCPEGELLAQQRIPMDRQASAEEMVARIMTTTEELLEANDLRIGDAAGIGIGAPGPLDTSRGILDCPPNLPEWHGFAVVEAMKQHVPASVPIRMENDATAAALAEKWVGAAQNEDHFVYLTISTGIGAGVYTHGRLVTGMSGNAGDVGHIVIDPSQGTCPCGQKGCWEHVASGTAIARQAAALMEQPGDKPRDKPRDAREVFEAYAAGDERMTALVEQVFTYIGMGCVTLINILDPQKIVIGGGVSQVGDPLFHSVQQYVRQYALSPKGKQTEIVPAHLHQGAGVIGAAALIWVS
ncbi:ROK family protein [Marinicrinis sediminis]|uniref:ROK family protein n=1 Tax=Marinicrinis sediminis TaxID=1652465 RepID=A0ABW5R8H5_9BACL